MKRFRLLTGDCIEFMRRLEDASVDSIVTDPPYGLGFMGKQWDELPPGKEWAEECLRVLKPGGHLLAFGGSRTYHRLAAAVEDAGFEIRDQIMWLYGSGFPKSLDVSKAIDRQRDDREQILQVADWLAPLVKTVGVGKVADHMGVTKTMVSQHWCSHSQTTVPKLDQIPLLLEVLGVDPADVPQDIARLIYELNGRKGQPGDNWFKREVVGTGISAIANKEEGQRHTVGASKAVEFDITAPATSQAAQWEGWGTALKPAHEPIVVARKPLIGTVAANVLEHGTGAINVDGCRVGSDTIQGGRSGRQSGSTFNASIGDQQKPHEGRWPANIILDKEAGEMLDEQQEGASRFFYCPKASKKERNAGTNKNIHPTVKPVELMRYLCRLVTPPGGVILDPFLGSGSTGCAVAAENNEQNPDWGFIGIEREAEYMDIAKARIKHWRNQEPKHKQLKLETPAES